MKAIIKSMWVNRSDIDLDNYFPENSKNFSLWIEFDIGPEDSSGADNFRVFVCTPEWLLKNIWTPQWGRHMLIVREYDRSTIEKFIYDYIEKCSAGDWVNIANKIAHNLAWEFENYQE